MPKLLYYFFFFLLNCKSLHAGYFADFNSIKLRKFSKQVNSNDFFPWWKRRKNFLGWARKGKFPIIMLHSKWMSEYVRKEKFYEKENAYY